MRKYFSRTSQVLLLPVLALIGLGAACVDPKGDFEDYVTKTNDVRGVAPDTGVSDVQGFETEDTANDAISGNYFMSCLPDLVKESPNASLLFYVEFISNGAGAFDFAARPLLETATTFSAAQTSPATFTQSKKGVVVTNGTWTVDIGSAQVPGDSQRIGASLLKLENVKWTGKIVNKDRMCVLIDGQAVEPLMIEFKKAPCVAIRLQEGDPLPKASGAGQEWIGFTAADHFSCAAQ